MNWLFIVSAIIPKVIGLEISVKEIEITQIPIYSFRQVSLTEDEYMVILLSIMNATDDKKFDVISWREISLFDNSTAKMFDEFQNEYHQISPRYYENFLIDKQLPNVFSVYPNEEVYEILVFQKPTNSSKNLKLILPGDNIEQPLPITINIPEQLFRSPTPTLTYTKTPQNTPTITNTKTITRTKTVTRTQTPTCTPTLTYTETPTPTLTYFSLSTYTKTPTKTLAPFPTLGNK